MKRQNPSLGFDAAHTYCTLLEQLMSTYCHAICMKFPDCEVDHCMCIEFVQ